MFNPTNLSFTTTALARPETIKVTYSSFQQNLKGIDLSAHPLIINIDPVPNNSQKVNETIEVALKFFPNCTFRTPKIPNFTSAINWCWSMAKTDFIFHLEDDWVLGKEIDLNEIWKFFKVHPETSQAIFRAYGYEYNKIALSPSIIKSALYSSISGKLDEKKNPEIQLRGNTFFDFTSVRFFVVGHEPIIFDIGRQWSELHGLRKPKKGDFITFANNDEFK